MFVSSWDGAATVVFFTVYKSYISGGGRWRSVVPSPELLSFDLVHELVFPTCLQVVYVKVDVE